MSRAGNVGLLSLFYHLQIWKAAVVSPIWSMKKLRVNEMKDFVKATLVVKVLGIGLESN